MKKLNLKPTKESLKKTIHGLRIIDWIDVKSDRYEFIMHDSIDGPKWLMELDKFPNKKGEYTLYLKLATGQLKKKIKIDEIKDQRVFYLTCGELIFEYSNSNYNTYIRSNQV